MSALIRLTMGVSVLCLLCEGTVHAQGANSGVRGSGRGIAVQSNPPRQGILSRMRLHRAGKNTAGLSRSASERSRRGSGSLRRRMGGLGAMGSGLAMMTLGPAYARGMALIGRRQITSPQIPCLIEWKTYRVSRDKFESNRKQAPALAQQNRVFGKMVFCDGLKRLMNQDD